MDNADDYINYLEEEVLKGNITKEENVLREVYIVYDNSKMVTVKKRICTVYTTKENK
jgi:hypothetical protein